MGMLHEKSEIRLALDSLWVVFYPGGKFCWPLLDTMRFLDSPNLIQMQNVVCGDHLQNFVVTWDIGSLTLTHRCS